MLNTDEDDEDDKPFIIQIEKTAKFAIYSIFGQLLM